VFANEIHTLPLPGLLYKEKLMPRNRVVKVEFWTSKTIAKLSIGARLFFIGLWNFADDQGVLIDSDRKIMGDLFPFDRGVTKKQVQRWKTELEKNQLIIKYTHNNQQLLIIKGWDEHQKVPNPSERRYLPEEIRLRVIRESLGSNEGLNTPSIPANEKDFVKGNINIKEKREREKGASFFFEEVVHVLYEGKYNEPYHSANPFDEMNMCVEMLKSFSYEDLKTRYEKFLASDEDNLVKSHHQFTQFNRRVNRYGLNGERGKGAWGMYLGEEK